jgi:mono/diheme cytochrome c family protein
MQTLDRGRSFARVTVVLALLVGFGGCHKGSSGASEAPDSERTFRFMCARCHGSDGTGGVPAAEGLPAPRNFHDTAFQDNRSDADIKNAIAYGRPPSMPPFRTAFNDAELDALVRKVRQFDPRRQK